MARRQRTLVLSSSLGEGGAQRVTSTLLSHLNYESIDVHLCLFKPVIEFSVPDEVSITTLLDRDLSLRTHPWLIPATVSRLRRLITRWRPDIVLSVIDQVNLVAAAALLGIPQRPRWIARSGTNPDCQSPLQRALTRLAYRNADIIIANAAALARRLAVLYPGARDAITYLPNPIDFDLLDRLALAPPLRLRDQARPLLVSVGRLVSEKRPDILIDALSRLRRHRSFEFWICGAGPLEPAVRRQISTLGLDDDVKLLGFCENPYALLAQADIFVMTSEFEGLPNGLIEAQGLGIPAVSTNCDFGPKEIVAHEETGLLVPVGAPGALAAALESLLDDDQARTAMAQAARERTRTRYAVESLIEQWQDLFEVGPLGWT